MPSECSSRSGYYDIETSFDDPYSPLIRQFLISEFPNINKISHSERLDLVTDAIISSGQVRYGPRPSPESIVAIRNVISSSMTEFRPIPFLVPWGSEKPDGSGVDVAELMALKTLKCLQDRVQPYYSGGIQAVVRLEDVSAPHLFYERAEQARKDAALYTAGFENLVKILGLSFVVPFKESSKVSETTFSTTADSLLPLMERHVLLPTNVNVINDLKRYGWSQPISEDTIGYYLKQYEKLYPLANREDHIMRLARYFAGALTRIHLGITGRNPEWENNFLELSFTGPIPGIPAARALRRILYRTMPCSISTNHMPAWRSKGHLVCREDKAVARLASFNELNPYSCHSVKLTGNGVSQIVQADYLVK